MTKYIATKLPIVATSKFKPFARSLTHQFLTFRGISSSSMYGLSSNRGVQTDSLAMMVESTAIAAIIYEEKHIVFYARDA